MGSQNILTPRQKNTLSPSDNYLSYITFINFNYFTSELRLAVIILLYQNNDFFEELFFSPISN